MTWQERLSVAPMMGYTDRHFRYFLRQMSQHTTLYTEMVTTGALLYGDVAQHLAYQAAELPLVLQLGGNDANALAQCAKLAQAWGYSAVNLNVGCPSDRVQNGAFGACLLKTPQVVADAVAAMSAAVSIPVTVKTRLGVDDIDSYEHLHGFVDLVAQAGCQTFILHARKAWLQGLSPKENREVPPLNYARVRQIKADFAQLQIILNGGIKHWQDVLPDNAMLDGFMLGRVAYEDPYIFAQADQALFASKERPLQRDEIVMKVMPYIENELLAKGLPITRMTRHLIPLFHGQVGAKQWRRHLSQHAHKPRAGLAVLVDALAFVTNQTAHC